MDKQSFIDFIKDGAMKAQKEFGICASLTIAQAILESAWGKSSPGNNLFGIKWTDGCNYEAQTLATKEFCDRTWKTINALFRKYNTLSDSLYDHAQFLISNNRYSNLIGVKDYKKACELIQKDGYATDPDYSRKLISIIEENKLYQYDKEVTGMKKIVVYYGDADLFAAVIVSQKNRCALMLKDDFEESDIKADEVITIGGKPNSTRFTTFKDAAALI